MKCFAILLAEFFRHAYFRAMLIFKNALIIEKIRCVVKRSERPLLEEVAWSRLLCAIRRDNCTKKCYHMSICIPFICFFGLFWGRIGSFRSFQIDNSGLIVRINGFGSSIHQAVPVHWAAIGQGQILLGSSSLGGCGIGRGQGQIPPCGGWGRWWKSVKIKRLIARNTNGVPWCWYMISQQYLRRVKCETLFWNSQLSSIHKGRLVCFVEPTIFEL